MDRARRCGFLEEEKRGSEKVVWSRGNITLTECPKSYVSAQSIFFLEAYAAWTYSREQLSRLDAKLADAVVVLEQERKATSNGNNIQS